MSDPPASRPWWQVFQRAGDRPSGTAIVFAALIAFVSALNLDIPYYAIEPGPAIDVVDLIEIDGSKPVSGRLLLTTVSLHEIKVGEAIRGWFDSDYEILSRSMIIPTGESEQEADRRSTAQMEESQQNASVAALRYLGRDVKIEPGLEVIEVRDDAPAKKVLHLGDVIVGVDAASISKFTDLQTAISKHKVGDEIVIKVRRGSVTVPLRTRTTRAEEKPTQAAIGVVLGPLVDLPLAIEINALNIGGPSAGLMYALGIVDLLNGSDLAAKRTIAGTGEISHEGVVGPVGGVEQKVAGALNQDADLFLVPAVELKAACARAGDMPVYAVQKLADAVRILSDPRFAATRDCP